MSKRKEKRSRLIERRRVCWTLCNICSISWPKITVNLLRIKNTFNLLRILFHLEIKQGEILVILSLQINDLFIHIIIIMNNILYIIHPFFLLLWVNFTYHIFFITNYRQFCQDNHIGSHKFFHNCSIITNIYRIIFHLRIGI